MNRHGAVEIILGAAGFQRDAEKLRHLARLMAENMDADNLAVGSIDDQLHDRLFLTAG
ncbi:hypothetical protein D3C71_1036300 [compost metagenome]